MVCLLHGCGILLALLAVGIASASPSPAFAAQAPVASPSFQLEGTNGYTIVILAGQPWSGRPGSVQIIARKGNMGVSYLAPATVTETSISADLGALGVISVSFHPSGQSTTSKCAGRKIEVAGGSYEGTIAFHGEEGYTDVEATSVPADIRPFLATACNFTTVTGASPNSRGAELFVRNPGLGPRFSVAKSGPAAPAHFSVEVPEYDAGISIHRFASFSMPAGSFRYGPNLQTAMVHPQAPFSGTAHFDRRRRANRRWSGDLTIDMPGLSNAALTGRQLRAGLVHAYQTSDGTSLRERAPVSESGNKNRSPTRHKDAEDLRNGSKIFVPKFVPDSTDLDRTQPNSLASAGTNRPQTAC
ncbi:MAG TPA: hypothetical protein VNS60_02355 [Solirubrobacterales bacterium]|nr:hypothetical protein [Solirubrobacterales bacterium]